MRLKTLEIKGFKSFANKTIINFDEDVIGVVGPNGSGKSNVVDAIRWVLGEQKTSELRLDKMGSVIFNGTKKRRQSGKAEVTLTFDNTKHILPTEYNTVKISRFLYRDGESEYRLNDVQCRLKDITSLFIDTGIGPDSYAIIALNMVDDLLSDKNNARRAMFEQASGISKYKIRKKQTLNKLKNTSADLERVEDLLFEIEGNLKTLEKQARRAKRYFIIKEDYKNLSLQLASIQIADSLQNQKDIEKEIQDETDNYTGLEAQLRKLESKLENIKKEHLEEERALSTQQRDVNELANLIRDQESNKRILEQKIAFNESNKKKLTEHKENAYQKIKDLTEGISLNRERLNEEKAIEAEMEKQLETIENQLTKIRTDHGILKSDLDAIMLGQRSAEKELFELEKQKAINTHRIESITSGFEHDKEKRNSLKSEIKDLKEKNKILEKQETEKRSFLADMEAQESKRDNEIKNTQEKLEALNEKSVKLNRTLDAKRNELQLTKSMVENLEGFPESIKYLSNKKNWDTKAPLLSDLIYVKEDYRVSVENYLDPYLNYYVVKNYDKALDAIRLLAKAQKGKANFFILDAIPDDIASTLQLKNTVNAIDVIEFDKEYKKLFTFLLQNVVISDEDVLSNDKFEKGISVISKSGKIIQRKFSLSGGSVGLFEGKKIGRKKNIEHLNTTIKKTETEETKLSLEVAKQKLKLDNLILEKSRDKIDSLNAELNNIAQQKALLAARLENFETTIKETDAKKELELKQVEELETSNATIEASLKEKYEQIEKSRDNISKTDSSFRKIAEELSSISAKFNEKNIEFVRQQNKVNTFQRELNYKEQQLEEVKNDLSSDEQGIEQATEELLQITQDIKEIENSLLGNYELKREKETSLTGVEQTYFKVRQEINETEENIRNINRQSHEKQIKINTLKEQNSNFRIKLSSITERLNVEFQASLDDLKAITPDPDIDVDQLQEKVEKLKNRIFNYGEINPMAMEAYDEIKERYDNITAQKNDILEAKESLLETITEIEEKATGQFLESFEKTRLFFIDVFRELFSEDDNCDLILVDPTDPLDSKIEIVAKPKGKRPLTISQLSGGEKTLTAIALLFSLYLLKPAPFCIFDEVDAPLDDTNIEKFNKIIRKFSKNSQFIVVTHNKLTMASVNTIYGIHMQEQGVSSVTPVDFRFLDHDPIEETVNGQ